MVDSSQWESHGHSPNVKRLRTEVLNLSLCQEPPSQSIKTYGSFSEKNNSKWEEMLKFQLEASKNKDAGFLPLSSSWAP